MTMNNMRKINSLINVITKDIPGSNAYQYINRLRARISEVYPCDLYRLKKNVEKKYQRCFDCDYNLLHPVNEGRLYKIDKIILREIWKYKKHRYMKDEYHNYCELCGLHKENPVHG